MRFKKNIYKTYTFLVSYFAQTFIGKKLSPILGPFSDILDSFVRKIVYRKFPSSYDMDGITIHFPKRGYFGIELTSGNYEPRTTALFKQLLSYSSTFVDVGAHVGYYSLLAANKSATVFAFEPDLGTFGFLLQNINSNNFSKTITPVAKAVCNTSGIINLYKGRRDCLTNSLFSNPGVNSKTSYCVATTLDDFFSEKGWPNIDLVKIDVEGAEYTVLQGMSSVIARNPQIKLLVEFSYENLRSAQVTPDEFFNLLQTLGFSKFSMILEQLVPLKVPDDIPVLVKRCKSAFINLICER